MTRLLLALAVLAGGVVFGSTTRKVEQKTLSIVNNQRGAWDEIASCTRTANGVGVGRTTIDCAVDGGCSAEWPCYLLLASGRLQPLTLEMTPGLPDAGVPYAVLADDDHVAVVLFRGDAGVELYEAQPSMPTRSSGPLWNLYNITPTGTPTPTIWPHGGGVILSGGADAGR